MFRTIKVSGKSIRAVMFTAVALCLTLAFASPAVAAPTWKGLAKKQVFSESEVKWVIGRFAGPANTTKGYRLSASDTTWLQNAAVDIIFRGRAESHGNTHAGAGHACRGIVQFNGAWKPNTYEKNLIASYEPWHKNDWRMSGIAELARMVRVMHDGGKPAVRRHWSATLGR